MKYPNFTLLFSFKMTNFVEHDQMLFIMKRINILLAFLLVIYTCTSQNHQPDNRLKESIADNLISFGIQIDANGTVNMEEMSEKYQKMIPLDTLQTKFTAIVSEVCKMKGCWMKLELTNGQETMVRFKDYGFFMPEDIKGKEVIVNGLAFVEEMSVEDQKHYAKDGGEFEEIINKISKPRKSYGFEADGVLIKE